LDIDVLTLGSFDPLLNLSDVVMAHQENDQDTACNAVLIGKKCDVFSNDCMMPIKVLIRLVGIAIPLKF
jgi:hypothetical protein